MTPPLNDDDRRVEALRPYAVFDTPPEEAFDNLTRLAARLCRAPIALLCFVGRNRQWFKSVVGLDLSDPKSHVAFCYHAVQQPDLFVVPDLTQDRRFAALPLVVADPHLRFYASASVVTPSGQPIGCLAVMDTTPRELTEDQADALRSLASQTALLLEERRQAAEQARDAALDKGRGVLSGSRTLFEQSHVMQLLVDPRSLAVVDANPEACRFYGRSIGELRARTFPSLFQAEPDGDEAAPSVEQPCFQLRHRLPSGDIREIEVYSSPVTVRGRNLRHLLLHDITVRNRHEQELKTVLTHARCILWIADVQEHNDRFHWWLRVSDLEAAMQVLPLDLQPGQPYALAWNESRHPEDRARIDAIGTAALRSGQRSYSQEFRCFDRDGKLHWLHEDVSLQPCEPGHWRAVGVCTDVTERKQAEQERLRLFREQAARAEAEAGQRRLQFLLETNTLLTATLEYPQALQNLAAQIVPEMADLCLIDMLEEDGSVRRMAHLPDDPAGHELAQAFPPPADLSEAGLIARVLRTGRSELFGPLSELVAADDAWVGGPLLPPRHSGAGRYECEGPSALQSEGALLCVALVARERVIGALTLISTHPERIYGAADLALAEDLARRAAIAVENARLFQQVQQADRAKDDFLAMLGHELRNPLGPIVNGLTILRLQPDPRMQERTRELMERQVRHMARLVDDLLDVSRIARGKIELRDELVELQRLVRETAEDHRRTLEEAGLTLSVEMPEPALWVRGDPTRLAQVLGNLLQNAAKFTGAGGDVSVEVARDDAQARVSVRDSGIGIEPEMLARVFEPFAQAERGLDRSQGGLGLGLALVKGLVELHGGEVSARSAGPGQGAEFAVCLPLHPPPAAATVPAAPEAAGSGRRVLIIEDSEDAARTLQDLLELAGHEVAVAFSGADGLELARRLQPEIVLCDIGLPGMDGYEVARALRQDPAGAGAYLIALSGYGQEEDRRRAEAAGFDRHLTKPADPQELHRLLGASPRPSGTPLQ